VWTNESDGGEEQEGGLTEVVEQHPIVEEPMETEDVAGSSTPAPVKHDGIDDMIDNFRLKLNEMKLMKRCTLRDTTYLNLARNLTPNAWHKLDAQVLSVERTTYCARRDRRGTN